MKSKSIDSQLKNLLDRNNYLSVKDVVVNDLKLNIYYLKASASMDDFNNYYFYRIGTDNYQKLQHVFPGIFFPISDITRKNLVYLLSRGYIIISINEEIGYGVELSNLNNIKTKSSHIDPTNVFEGNDDFGESINSNLALLIKRLKTSNLQVKHYFLGNESKTDCYVLYMNEYSNKGYVKEIVRKIENCENADEYFLNINDVSNQFNDSGIVPLFFYTSSPNTICSNLIKGRVVIMVDNTPVACVLPASLSTFTSIKNELNTPVYYTVINKIFICVFFFLSVFALSAFISIMNFHTSLLSPVLIANIQLTERGTSFPIFIEILIVLFLFDFYRYSTSRTPQNYIQNIVIFFGGLVIGQNAVEAGVVGSLIMMITSLCYLSSFAITTNPYMITTLNIFRIFILLFSYTLGLIGFVFSSIVVIIYLTSKKSVGVSFFEPFSPLSFKNIINFFSPSKKGSAIDL